MTKQKINVAKCLKFVGIFSLGFLVFATKHGYESRQAAALQNLSGEFLKPSTEAGAKALNGISLDQNLAGKNPNPTIRGAYPIATLTWILAYEIGNGSKTKAIQESLNYLLSDKAQEKAPSLGFVPLKGDILAKSRAAVKRIGK